MTLRICSRSFPPIFPAGFTFLLILAAVLTCAFSAPAGEDTAPATAGAEEGKKRSFSTGTALFDDGTLSGGVYYFQRDRRRQDLESGEYKVNLDHSTLQANAEFSSGFAGGVIGFDFGVFGSTDTHNDGAVDHEMNFMPWGNPWRPDWSKKRTEDGVSVYMANVKAKAGPAWGRVGYFQPSGPGVLGVNWSIMPGTYRGAEAGVDLGGLSLAAAWADGYKAPWFQEINAFRKTDGDTRVDWMWSLGARYRFASGLNLEAAYGESQDYLKNAHIKAGYAMALGPGKLSVGYHLYLMDDSDDDPDSANNNFAGIASQHYLYTRYSLDAWTFLLEGTHTRAPFDGPLQQENFAYRLTAPNGSSKGAYECWWNARSDWNAHNETALFGQIGRRLDDILPVRGFNAAIGAGIGWDGKGYGVAEHFKEWAFTFDLGYTHPEGPLKGAFVKLHYTEYVNGSRQPDWTPYHNAFQDEHDFMLFAGIPFSL